jgi:hypothetical protein
MLTGMGGFGPIVHVPLIYSLLLLGARLESQEGIRDEKVERKFEAALALRAAAARAKGRKVSPWVRALRRITRWSSQFTRWLQDALVHDWGWHAAVAKLKLLMRAYLRQARDPMLLSLSPPAKKLSPPSRHLWSGQPLQARDQNNGLRNTDRFGTISPTK